MNRPNNVQRQQYQLLAEGKAIDGLIIEFRIGEVIEIGGGIQIQLCAAVNRKAKVRIHAPGMKVNRPKREKKSED